MLTFLIPEIKLFDENNIEINIKANRADSPKKYLRYKTNINGKEIIINCPVYIEIDRVSEILDFIRYIPALIVPRKKFPLHVYLYAVILYLTSKLSMRKVSEMVCSKFNLKSFSYSIISRLLKKLSLKHEEFKNIFKEEVSQNEFEVYPELVVRKKWDDLKINIMKYLSILLSPILKSPESESISLAIKYSENSENFFLI